MEMSAADRDRAGGGKNVEKNIEFGQKQFAVDLQNQVLSAVKQTQSAFGKVIIMYLIAFYLGVAIVLASIYMTLFSEDKIAAGIIGGVGILDLFAFVIFKPIEGLQASRGRLFQVQAILISWFNDIDCWTQYIRADTMSLEKLEKILSLIQTNVIKLVELMGAQLTFETQGPPIQANKGSAASGSVETPAPKGGTPPVQS